MAVKKQNWGWMRHVLTTISVCFFMLGCAIIGYMTWVLATSSLSISGFMSGTQLFTYAVIGQALFLFLNGLIGSVGSYTKTAWLVHMFIGASVLFILVEIGGIIAVNIINIDMEDIVERGWLELNQHMRNLIQSNLDCCGLNGPQDFAFSSSPIDETCYEPIDSDESSSFSALLAPENVLKSINPHFRLKKMGCGSQLNQWLEDHKIGWVTVLAAIGAFEFMATVIAVFILRRLKTNSRPRTLSRRRLRQHEVEIANDPLPSELP